MFLKYYYQKRIIIISDLNIANSQEFARRICPENLFYLISRIC